MKKHVKKKIVRILVSLLVVLIIVGSYHTHKPLPKGVSYESKPHKVEDVFLLSDLTYQDRQTSVSEQHIFQAVTNAIDDAKAFIIMDMFLFNGYYNQGETFPHLSDTLASKLIEKKRKHPNIEIVFITDEINTIYGSHDSKWLDSLRLNGIKVVQTNLSKLRDSIPLYSSMWRTFVQLFGEKGTGWITNPFGNNAPNVTARAYFKLLNVKANHRKVVATDQSVIISSANPHDASFYNSNMAFEVKGNIIGDVVKSEQAVSDFSYGGRLPLYKKKEKEKGDLYVQLLTEGKIYKHVLNNLRHAKKGDDVWLGMFYLGDRDVIKALLKASEQGANVRLILDPNENAFGRKKFGLPNRPVAAELVKKSKGDIKVRWYHTRKEQYHPKTLFIRNKRKAMIIAGAANFTKRNLDDLNLETDIKVSGPPNKKVMTELNAYFDRLWTNKDYTYTLPYKRYENKMTRLETLIYRIQDALSLTTY
ncbi:phospholipase D family protein [Priestia aryabhattai]|uniref:phospholipase D family protein n=1 Tax=Priestia aryabhattai TaxID=412384 RepID=UPI001593F23B